MIHKETYRPLSSVQTVQAEPPNVRKPPVKTDVSLLAKKYHMFVQRRLITVNKIKHVIGVLYV